MPSTVYKYIYSFLYPPAPHHPPVAIPLVSPASLTPSAHIDLQRALHPLPIAISLCYTFPNLSALLQPPVPLDFFHLAYTSASLHHQGVPALLNTTTLPL